MPRSQIAVSVKCRFIHSQIFVSIYYVSGTVLGTEDTLVNKTEQVHALTELMLPGEEMINNNQTSKQVSNRMTGSNKYYEKKGAI